MFYCVHNVMLYSATLWSYIIFHCVPAVETEFLGILNLLFSSGHSGDPLNSFFFLSLWESFLSETNKPCCVGNSRKCVCVSTCSCSSRRRRTESLQWEQQSEPSRADYKTQLIRWECVYLSQCWLGVPTGSQSWNQYVLITTHEYYIYINGSAESLRPVL